MEANEIVMKEFQREQVDWGRCRWWNSWVALHVFISGL